MMMDRFMLNRISNFIREQTLEQLSNNMNENVPVGLTPEQINNLERSTATERTQCSVCLEDIIPEADVIKLHCNHVFHERCLLNWARRRNTCPVCRASIVTPTENTENETESNTEPNTNIRRANTGVNLTINHVVTVPLDITVFLKIGELELETIWQPHTRIFDIFEYISRLAVCNEYRNSLVIRFIGDDRIQHTYKITEPLQFLKITLIECRSSPLIVMHISSQ